MLHWACLCLRSLLVRPLPLYASHPSLTYPGMNRSVGPVPSRRNPMWEASPTFPRAPALIHYLCLSIRTCSGWFRLPSRSLSNQYVPQAKGLLLLASGHSLPPYDHSLKPSIFGGIPWHSSCICPLLTADKSVPNNSSSYCRV
jgi:hypothetical protein